MKQNFITVMCSLNNRGFSKQISSTLLNRMFNGLMDRLQEFFEAIDNISCFFNANCLNFIGSEAVT